MELSGQVSNAIRIWRAGHGSIRKTVGNTGDKESIKGPNMILTHFLCDIITRILAKSGNGPWISTGFRANFVNVL